MRLIDILNQLRLILPRYTDLFSDNTPVSSIVVLGGIATVTTTAAHGLTTGNAVNISGAKSKTEITGVSQDGLLFTFTSDTHDLTLGWPEQENIELIGFTDSAWNGTFELKGVPNRQSFIIQSTETIPTLNGNEELLEIKNTGVNGMYSITVTSTTTFTFGTGLDNGTYLDGVVSSNVRIAGTVNIERTIEQYTKQGLTDLWGFVVMHDVETSKDRSTYSDATSTPTQGSDIRLRLIDGFSFYIFVNVTQDIAATTAIDICRDTLLLPILKTLFGVIFDSGVTGEDFRNIMTGQGIAHYDTAIYVHVYNFETSMDIFEADAVIPSNTRAFRDIEYTHNISDTEALTANIDLDEEPL